MRIYKAISHVYQHISGIPVQRRRIGNISRYMCTGCQYESNRQYNVQRHKLRIHSNRKLRICCGIQFFTKGDYYVHCEQLHPETRAKAITSKLKYKITNDLSAIQDEKQPKRNGNLYKMQLRSKYSERIRMTGNEKQAESKVSVEYSMSCTDFDIEDVPLIRFLTERRWMSLLKRWPTTNFVNQAANAEHDEKTNQTVNIAISSKQKIEETVSAREMENNPEKVFTTSVDLFPHALPTKKLILQRFRSSLMHEFQILLMQRNKNDCDQPNFRQGKESAPGACHNCNSTRRRDTDRADKENVSKYKFNLAQQLNVKLDTAIVGPSTTQVHRDFLNSIDFDRYKIF